MAGWYPRLTALLCALFLLQGGVSVTAQVDRTTVSTDETFTLTVTVAGDFQQLGEPQLPALDGLSIVGSSRASQFSMVNGVVTARTVFTYRLQPTATGALTIPAITVQVNGVAYQTDPITVQAVQGTAPTPTPPPAAPPSTGGPTGQELYVEADIDNPTPYVGQQITYRFRFYQSVNLFEPPDLKWPSFSGFWTEDLRPNNVYDTRIGGRLYRVTEVRRALFPTSAGQHTIAPTTLVIPGDFFNPEARLTTQPVSVTVRPLPPGAPDGFAGVVGQFEIQAQVEPAETQVNEPVTLRVRVSGAGNLTALPDPTEGLTDRLADWRVYAAQVTTHVAQDDETIRGDRIFERLLVPATAGDLTLPALTLVYFDPQAEAYRQATTEPLIVHVAPADQPAPVVAANSDIRHIKAAPPALNLARPSLLERPLYWLGWLVPLLTTVGVWGWDRHRRRLGSDRARVRARRAHRLARHQLAQARAADPDAAYTAVAQALTAYIADHFDLPPAGLTRDAIRDALEARTVPADLVERTLHCLDWADAGRFAPIAAGRPAADLITEAQSVLAQLEQALTR